MSQKTLDDVDPASAKQNVADIEVCGNPDAWKLICKASSQSEGWMKSTKAMNVYGAGCLVQVTTQQNDEISESITFAQNVMTRKSQLGDGYYLVDFGQKNVSEQELINSLEV